MGLNLRNSESVLKCNCDDPSQNIELPAIEVSISAFINRVVESKIQALLNDEAAIGLLKERLKISEQPDELFNTEQACAYLHISRGTLNTRMQRGEIIPETPKNGSRNLFSKKHLRESIKQKRKPQIMTDRKDCQ